MPIAHRDHVIVAGVGWARLHDFTAISVVCCDCQCEVALDRFNQIGWAFQRERLLSLMNHWSVKHALIESNSIGSPNLEALHEHLPQGRTVRGFETTAKSKPKLIQSLALCFERSHLQWLPDPIARHELIAYEATRTEAGNTKYGAPEGGWDDTVIARALAWRAAKAFIPVPLSEDEQLDAMLPKSLRRDSLASLPAGTSDYAMLQRNWELAQLKEARNRQRANWSHELIDPNDDPWQKMNRGNDNPWGNL